jgi:hypothetical protein
MVSFQTKNLNLGIFWTTLECKMWFIPLYSGHLEYFTTIWYNLWPFGIACGHLLYFTQFGMFKPRKIWQPWLGAIVASKISPATFQVINYKESDIRNSNDLGSEAAKRGNANDFFFRWKSSRAGVDVMITIFCDFRTIFGEKIGVFLKNQCHDQTFP